MSWVCTGDNKTKKNAQEIKVWLGWKLEKEWGFSYSKFLNYFALNDLRSFWLFVISSRFPSFSFSLVHHFIFYYSDICIFFHFYLISFIYGMDDNISVASRMQALQSDVTRINVSFSFFQNETCTYIFQTLNVSALLWRVILSRIFQN
jgi:hypothetical protein